MEKNNGKVLDLVMKRENAEAILNGTKWVEYRQVTDFYINKLLYKDYIKLWKDEGMDWELVPMNEDYEYIHFHNYSNTWYLDVYLLDRGIVPLCEEGKGIINDKFQDTSIDVVCEKFERDLKKNPKLLPHLMFFLELGGVIDYKGLDEPSTEEEDLEEARINAEKAAEMTPEEYFNGKKYSEKDLEEFEEYKEIKQKVYDILLSYNKEDEINKRIEKNFCKKTGLDNLSFKFLISHEDAIDLKNGEIKMRAFPLTYSWDNIIKDFSEDDDEEEWYEVYTFHFADFYGYKYDTLSDEELNDLENDPLGYEDIEFKLRMNVEDCFIGFWDKKTRERFHEHGIYYKDGYFEDDDEDYLEELKYCRNEDSIKYLREDYGYGIPYLFVITNKVYESEGLD